MNAESLSVIANQQEPPIQAAEITAVVSIAVL